MALVPNSPGWTLEPHDADIIVCGLGDTEAEAFANAARALTAAVTPLECIALDESVAIRCEAPDPEMLLFDWLNAVIFEMATRGMLFGDFQVIIEGGTLAAELRGEAVDPFRHAPAVEPKGATLSELSVRRLDDGRWAARCLVDV